MAVTKSNIARSRQRIRRPDPVCLYSVKEVAQQCNLSEKTIRRHIENGRLRVQRVGHAIRISHEELLIFLRLPPQAAR